MVEERSVETDQNEAAAGEAAGMKCGPPRPGPIVDLERMPTSPEPLSSAREPLLSTRSSLGEPTYFTDAHMTVLREEILRLSNGSGEVTYGILCRDERVAGAFEKLLAALKYARRKGVLTFQGQLLMMGHHDGSMIRLLDAGDDGLGVAALIPTTAPFVGADSGACRPSMLGSLVEEVPWEDADAAITGLSSVALPVVDASEIPPEVLPVPLHLAPSQPTLVGRPEDTTEDKAGPSTTPGRPRRAPGVTEESLSQSPEKSCLRASSHPAQRRHDDTTGYSTSRLENANAVPSEERQKPTEPPSSSSRAGISQRIANFEGGFSERLAAFNDRNGWTRNERERDAAGAGLRASRPTAQRFPESSLAAFWSGSCSVSSSGSAASQSAPQSVPSLSLGNDLQASMAAVAPVPQMSARTLARANSAPTLGASGRKDHSSKWKVDTSYVAICSGGISDLAKRADAEGPSDLNGTTKGSAEYSDPDAEKYSYDALRGKANRPGQVDPLRKEEYLEDEEFRSIFSMEPAEFKKLPKWRRQDLKKAKDLF